MPDKVYKVRLMRKSQTHVTCYCSGVHWAGPFVWAGIWYMEGTRTSVSVVREMDGMELGRLGLSALLMKGLMRRVVYRGAVRVAVRRCVQRVALCGTPMRAAACRCLALASQRRGRVGLPPVGGRRRATGAPDVTPSPQASTREAAGPSSVARSAARQWEHQRAGRAARGRRKPGGLV